MPEKHILLLFTRYPVPGKSKTRLIPALGPDGASELQRRLTEKLVAEIRGSAGENLHIYFDGGTQAKMRSWLGAHFSYRRQSGGDIGRRMSSALLDHHAPGRSVCLVGSDCPHLDRTIVDHAFAALEHHDVVLGPSHDGGYYLIGCGPGLDTGTIPRLFGSIAWGTSTVLAETVAILNREGLTRLLLPKLHDIDTPADLRHIGYYSGPQ